MPKLHVLGVRHHGPGSARSVLAALNKISADIILIEGPADISPMIDWLAHEDMQPPIALVNYRADEPKRAGFYPMVVYSPEYQAIRYAQKNKIKLEFFDLPQKYLLATDAKVAMPDGELMQQMAEAAGYGNYERWWNVLIEQRKDPSDFFAAVNELMSALREYEAVIKQEDMNEGQVLAAQREAYMRFSIRKAVKDGYESIAVVCGAYHGPALLDYDTEEADLLLLEPLQNKVVEVESAWVPWSYSRLSAARGYGAGIVSPGWYKHLWQQGIAGADAAQMSATWLSGIASLLRSEGFDASPAHVIESVRLANNLAAMRALPFPALQELSEATQAVMTFGDDKPLQLIKEKLIIGEAMGAVPADAPMVPLQRDLQNLQRKLKLQPRVKRSTLMLDLRKELHLERSHLLHRLIVLNIPWGKLIPSRNREGNFREIWAMEWMPELAIKVIEANIWGNTVLTASEEYAKHLAETAESLADLTKLLELIILAELPQVISKLISEIKNSAALSKDVSLMMKALPPLAKVMRYGSIRKNDKEMISEIVLALISRISISLPMACTSIADSVAAELYQEISDLNIIINTLAMPDLKESWHKALKELNNKAGVHSLLAGRACRMLVEARAQSAEATLEKIEQVLYLSPLSTKSSKEVLSAAFWLEGFLKGSGMLLVHDQKLWLILERWVSALKEDNFMEVLPLLRRTFASFSSSIRQLIMEKVNGSKLEQKSLDFADFDQSMADKALPVLIEILGEQNVRN